MLPGSTIRTRQTTRQTGPDQYTMIPVLAKILKLLINEFSNNLNEALASSQDDDEPTDDEWEDEEEDEGLGMDNSSADQGLTGKTSNELMISQIVDSAFSTYQDDDDEEDPDAMADPIYNLNLKQYLTEFLGQFCAQPYFPHFVEHLAEPEKISIRSLGISVP